MIRRIFRWSLVVVVALAVWLGFGFFGAQKACAHDPRFACSPRDDRTNGIAVTDVARSWAYYGRLAPGTSDDYGLFVTQKSVDVPIGILIEKRDAGNAARPVLTVRDAQSHVVLARDLNDAASFYEPFSGIDYLTSKPVSVTLHAGLYSAIVAMRGGSAAQRYVFTVGQDEDFSPGEIPYVLGAIWRVRTVGY